MQIYIGILIVIQTEEDLSYFPNTLHDHKYFFHSKTSFGVKARSRSVCTCCCCVTETDRALTMTGLVCQRPPTCA